jgi:twitching motility protein PilT
LNEEAEQEQELEQIIYRPERGGAQAGYGSPHQSPRRIPETHFQINDLLEVATQRQASDLIITVEAPPTMRNNEDLTPVGSVKCSPDDTEALLWQMLTQDMAARFERHGEVDFAYSIPGIGRYRINGFRQRGSVGVVARIIPARIRTISELGLPDVVASLARRPNGLILVTGPTGSGKTTTLASMIDLINTEESFHILTLEDPIEFLHRHKRSLVNQREIGKDTRTYETGLRAALRENPDVILVGELRDLETIRIAMTAAETGHLVLSTLHTSDAAQTIDRVVDVFPPHQQDQIRVQLAATLQGILAQTLVLRADGRGRVGAFEILVATPAIRNLIREGKSYQIPTQLQTGARFGMRTMENSLRDLVERGQVSPEEYRSRMSHLAETGAHVSLGGPGGAPVAGSAGQGGQGGQGGPGGQGYGSGGGPQGAGGRGPARPPAPPGGGGPSGRFGGLGGTGRPPGQG